jgi:hypothetical protein
MIMNMTTLERSLSNVGGARLTNPPHLPSIGFVPAYLDCRDVRRHGFFEAARLCAATRHRQS